VPYPFGAQVPLGAEGKKYHTQEVLEGTMSKKPIGVLILHGFKSSLDCVRAVEQPIKNKGLPYRMPILRGHCADSPLALQNVTWHDWVSDAESAMHDLLRDAEKVIVIGLSMGGLIAIDLAAKHGEDLDSIILLAAAIQLTHPTAPGRPFYFVIKILATIFRPFLKYIKQENVFHYADPVLQNYDTNYRWTPLNSNISMLEFAEVGRKQLAKVTVPTLILQSHADSTVSPESANIIYNEISTPVDQKRIVWFERTDHEMLRDCESEFVVDPVMQYVRERVGER
jgi:carboxylesterase